VTLRQQHDTVHVSTRRGLNDVTVDVTGRLRASGLRDGLCTVFIRHTSASLVIQENADPAARRDLEAYLDRLVPDGDPLYTHTAEGDDDMPSHVKAALTRTSEQIPFRGGELVLGTWQGIYVWEHRTGRHRREIAVHLVGE
jgi:secondary thiamine-phosphate synthase enzyme